MALSRLKLARGRVARRLHDESGYTLTELLISASLMILVMGAVYGALTTFQNSSKRTNNQNDAQEQARAATDNLAYQLRNLVMPANAGGGPFELSGSYDVVFQT